MTTATATATAAPGLSPDQEAAIAEENALLGQSMLQAQLVHFQERAINLNAENRALRAALALLEARMSELEDAAVEHAEHLDRLADEPDAEPAAEPDAEPDVEPDGGSDQSSDDAT